MDSKIDNKMVLFTNWLNEDFVGKWSGVEEVFKSGKSKWVEDWKAEHYAKHLVDQYLNNKGIPTNHFTREEFIKKCFGEGIEASANIQSEIFNKNVELAKESNPESKPESKPVEKEFQELNGNNQGR